MLAGGLAIAPGLLGHGPRAGWLWALGAIGVLATVLAVLRFAGATWWGVISLGAEYTVLRIGRGPVDIGAAYVAMGLLLIAELVMWSLDARSRVVDGAAVVRRRLVQVALLGLGTLVLGSLIVSAGRLGHGPALTRTLVGVVCASAILTVVAWVSSTRSPPPAMTDPNAS